MKSNELKGLIKKGDIIIIFSLVIICLLWFFLDLFPLRGEAEVCIYLQGEEIYSSYLKDISEDKTVRAGECEILLSPQGACFLSSPCKDSLCIKRGMLTKAGDVMACVPEGVVVEIKAEKSRVDGVSY